MRNKSAILLFILLYGFVINCEAKKLQRQSSPVRESETGIDWQEGQAFPHFAVPADTLDGFLIEDPSLSPEDKVMMTVLQGLVNKVKPSIFLLRPESEGMYWWATKLGLNIRECPADKRWELIRKYRIPAYTKQNKLVFLPNYPCYTGSTDVFVNMNRDTIANFDRSHPVFLTAQGVSWQMGPDSLLVLEEKLEKLSPDNIVFCRGDHFFALYNEANHMDFNLMLSAGMQTTSGGKKWIRYDFRKAYKIDRYVVRQVDNSFYNTKDFTVKVISDGKKWITVDKQVGNISNVTDKDIAPVSARYVQIDMRNAGKYGISSIDNVEIYGSVIK